MWIGFGSVLLSLHRSSDLRATVMRETQTPHGQLDFAVPQIETVDIPLRLEGGMWTKSVELDIFLISLYEICD